MKDRNEFDSPGGDISTFVSFVKFIFIIIGIPVLLLLLICYNLTKDVHFFDYDTAYFSKNSKEAWSFFKGFVSSDTATIYNVTATEASTSQRDYCIKFETDSSSLFEIIEKHSLRKSKEPGRYSKRDGNTVTNIDYHLEKDTYYAEFSLRDSE